MCFSECSTPNLEKNMCFFLRRNSLFFLQSPSNAIALFCITLYEVAAFSDVSLNMNIVGMQWLQLHRVVVAVVVQLQAIFYFKIKMDSRRKGRTKCYLVETAVAKYWWNMEFYCHIQVNCIYKTSTFKVYLFNNTKTLYAIPHSIFSDIPPLVKERICCCITEYNKAKYDLLTSPLRIIYKNDLQNL